MYEWFDVLIYFFPLFICTYLPTLVQPSIKETYGKRVETRKSPNLNLSASTAPRSRKPATRWRCPLYGQLGNKP